MIRGGGWWSADQIRAMKAQAWDEGYGQAVADEHGVLLTPDEFGSPNPYGNGWHNPKETDDSDSE